MPTTRDETKDHFEQGTGTYNGPSILVFDVMLLLELRQFLFPPCKLRLSGSSILFCRHMVQHDDVPFLQVEPVQMV